MNDPVSTDLGPSPIDDDIDPTGSPVWSPAEHCRIRHRLLAEHDAAHAAYEMLGVTDYDTSDAEAEADRQAESMLLKMGRLKRLMFDEFEWLVKHEMQDGHADPHDFCDSLATLTPAPVARVIALANAGLVPLPDRHTHGYNDLQPTPSDSEVADRHLIDVHHWPKGKSRQYGVGHLIEMHATEHDGGALDPEPVPQPIPPAEVEQVCALAVYIAFTAVGNQQISGNIQVTLTKPVDLQRVRDVEALIAADLLNNSGTSVRQVIITGIFPLDPPRVSE